MKVVAVAGTPGSGKGTVADYLVTKKGFMHYSAVAFIVEEIERRGLPVNRDTMGSVSNDMRAQHSPSYIIEELYKRAVVAGKDAVIEAVRTVGEVDFLQEQGAVLIGVDADQKERYERILKRKSKKDSVTFEKFQEQEAREQHSDDPAKQNVAAVLERADVRIDNNGTLEELKTQIEVALKG